MALPTVVAREATSPSETFGLAFEGTDVIPKFWVLRPWSIGLLVTLIQLFVAVLLLAPEGPFSFRYQSLVQHDGYWFANIVDRGYQTIVPPINHKLMERAMARNFSWATAAERYETLYREIAAQNEEAAA